MLVIVWCLQIAAVFAVSFAAINATKDSYVINNQLSTKSGSIVQTASVDYCVSKSGGLTVRVDGACPSEQNIKPPALATAASTISL